MKPTPLKIECVRSPFWLQLLLLLSRWLCCIFAAVIVVAAIYFKLECFLVWFISYFVILSFSILKYYHPNCDYIICVFFLCFLRFFCSCAHGTPSRIPLIALNQRTKCSEFDGKASRDTIDPYDGRAGNVNEYHASAMAGLPNAVDDLPNETQVPVLVIVSILIVYISIGTAIFSVWENWSFVDGAYFCFVTISTIGFADLVPRKTFQGPDLQLFACCTYLIVGLILVTMSFTLLESQLMWRCKRIAMRFKRAQE